tara:strand:+ start:41 stop:919 length:879 start_codon:yes stop_codon:yes gene_type:complete
MSNELAVATERGQSMAELMGVSSSTSEGTLMPTIARLSLQQMQPIMGEVELNGKMIKTEVVPIGSFKLDTGDKTVYSETATVRVFVQRRQFQRWNSETEEMEKSVMANNTNGDLKDSIGGLNLGRPTGYIEDFESLPEETKQVIRSVKLVNIMYGTVTMKNPINDQGNTVDDVIDLPFVMDIKNNDSRKSINGVMAHLKKKNLLPIMSTIELEGITGTVASGAKFGKLSAKLGVPCEISNTDNDTLKDFLELIEYNNGKILDLYHERSKGHADEDAELVGEILNNDFVEVAE